VPKKNAEPYQQLKIGTNAKKRQKKFKIHALRFRRGFLTPKKRLAEQLNRKKIVLEREKKGPK